MPPGADQNAVFDGLLRRVNLDVVLISKWAGGSKRLLHELELAVANNVRVLPFRLDDTPLSDELVFLLGTAATTEVMSGTPQERLLQLVRRVRQLLRENTSTAYADVVSDLDGHRAARAPAVRAPKPSTDSPSWGRWLMRGGIAVGAIVVVVMATLPLLARLTSSGEGNPSAVSAYDTVSGMISDSAKVLVNMPTDQPVEGLQWTESGQTGTLLFPAGSGMDFVWVEPGRAKLGDARGLGVGVIRPETRFESGFWLGRYEVTQEQWAAVMGVNPSSNRNPNYPVENVSWNDCQEFFRVLQEHGAGEFRLPSGPEWEYACRGGTETLYSFGDDPGQLEAYGWWNANSGRAPHAVGLLQPNPWGLYDMHGNVEEWCNNATELPTAKGQFGRVTRGGCYLSERVWELETPRRNVYPEDESRQGLGFRCSRTAKQGPTTKPGSQ
jgi:formylglycine-generating enzyme required for sulfatase activity